jgi:hypothetical protein
VRWLARAGWKPLLRVGIRVGIEGTIGGPVGDFLLAAEAAYWAYKAYPYIKSYFDPPKTLEELRKNEKPGYDDHHVVERWSKNDGIPESKIESPDIIVPIPKLKHWEINRWLSTKTDQYKDASGNELTPRQYIRDKSVEERREFGLMVLRKFGVLK